jgi:hypothetical protein
MNTRESLILKRSATRISFETPAAPASLNFFASFSERPSPLEPPPVNHVNGSATNSYSN